MFTGIVTHTARIRSHATKNKSLFLTIEKPKDWKLSLGESIATNGVCLTVKKIASKEYIVELMPETTSKTTFGIAIPPMVNLERSLMMGDRLGGHLVTGHIDAIGRIEKIEVKGNSKIYSIYFPKFFQKFTAAKGSITVDGVSLTVVAVKGNIFSVSLVEYTTAHTTLGERHKGDQVNLEFDILAKYVHNR
jgi:riboflavin synthase